MNKLIDTHVHLWHYTKSEFPWITEEMHALSIDRLFDDVEVVMKKKNVSQVVLVQARQTRDDTKFLCNIAKDEKKVLGVIGWTNLFSENRVEELEQLQSTSAQYKLRGFRHFVQDESYPNFMMQNEFVSAMRLLKKYGFLYEVLIKAHQFSQFIALLHTLNESEIPTLVLDHMGKPQIGDNQEAFSIWKANIRRVSDFPQVSCKVSGLLTEVVEGYRGKINFKPYIDVAYEAFGADRLMLGSDWPVCTLEDTYSESLSVAEYLKKQVSSSEWDKITYGTAEKVYGKL